MTLPACSIILFGATGDLAKRKLIPALFKLHRQKTLHKETIIIAIGRREYTGASIAKEFKAGLPKELARAKEWSAFTKRISYVKLAFDDTAAYGRLAAMLRERESRTGVANRLFYLATPPDAFPIISRSLKTAGLAERDPEHRWHRLVFEKPFGTDLGSAQRLNKEITSLFSERQVYRIDHYLGKGFVHEIMVLRFSNLIFDTLWDAQHIDHVRITVLEKHSVGSRGGYYDRSGALRDMVQNHLLQLVALAAMEAPATLDASDIHDEKVKVFKAVRPDVKSLVLGQYTPGVIDGKKIPDYTKEEGVAPNSATETYAAVKLSIANKRWSGVPFLLRTGKALRESYAEVTISFKQSPCFLFCGADGKLPANELTVRIQPEEGVCLSFNLADNAGQSVVERRSMKFMHAAEFGMNTPEAYEVLMAEAMRGDQTLFTRWDEVELCWRIIDGLRAAKAPILKYKAGSDGPTK
ncbi:TPA: glucose-6-phosphate dehydrogenase [Candidatus Woesearchaeota archaeon]|nr:glucose-6-phosphate dehydrogenase [Candidatus Woesearchaeota archaeon]